MANPTIEARVSDIRTILDRQHNGASSLLAVMEEIQGRYRYLPREALIMVSERLPVPLSRVYSVATFYNAFNLTPQGRHRYQVCTGTACYVRGAMQVLDRLETLLGIESGQTTDDLEYTLDTVNCLGACALGPIVVADSAYEGLMSSVKVDKLLKRIRREDVEREAAAGAAEAARQTDPAPRRRRGKPIRRPTAERSGVLEDAVDRLTGVTELQAWRQAINDGLDPERPRLRVCDGTGCRALGSQKLLAALGEAVNGGGDGKSGGVEIVVTGCPGFCEQGPLVSVDPAQIAYMKVSPDDAEAIVNETLGKGVVIDKLLYVDPVTGEPLSREPDLPFYSRQTRRVTALSGQIDPCRIEDYVAKGGYAALAKALHEMNPEGIIDEVTRSGLRGRGGAGFPTGVKWKFCRQSPGDIKYVICNADEGDPGAFMDRSLLEANPHSVVEGMIIGARAIGATAGYIYARSEYPLAVEHLEIALQQARQHGLLGDDILGSGFDFDIEMRLGAGAFVCGEETALMASIEGRPGEPRPRPPFPAQEGLWGRPTNINNVKSWANVTLIIDNGADWFAGIGTDKSSGTAIFSMVGKINNTGLVEVPMGISLRELVYDVGGGIPNGKEFKAVQIGGPSGGCIPTAHLDAPIDYDSLSKLGAIMGSGGLVVTDEDTCMVDLARFFMNFVQEESCGQCLPCRWGTRVMLDILTRICDGEGEPGDLETLEDLAKMVKVSSLCGLGQTAPNPVLSTLRYFRDEYEAHVHEKRCPAKICRGLITYSVDQEVCNGCMVCARSCPVEAISGEKLKPHVIDADLCTRCGMCLQLCKFDGIKVA